MEVQDAEPQERGRARNVTPDRGVTQQQVREVRHGARGSSSRSSSSSSSSAGGPRRPQRCLEKGAERALKARAEGAAELLEARQGRKQGQGPRQVRVRAQVKRCQRSPVPRPARIHAAVHAAADAAHATAAAFRAAAAAGRAREACKLGAEEGEGSGLQVLAPGRLERLQCGPSVVIAPVAALTDTSTSAASTAGTTSATRSVKRPGPGSGEGGEVVKGAAAGVKVGLSRDLIPDLKPCIKGIARESKQKQRLCTAP